MYQSSAAFGELIQQDSRTFKARITIDGESTSGVIKGLVLNGGSNTEDDFSIGSAFSQYVEVTISGTDTRFEGHEFFLEMGAVGVEEYIPMGYFTAGKPETDEEQISFTAYDRMAKLDMPCFMNLSETTDTISVLKAIGTISGVPVITSGLSYITMTKPVGYTCREVLSYVAQMYGGFAICNRSGQIEIKTYQDSGYTVPTGRYWDSFTHNDYDFVLDKLTCYTGKDESGNDISISVGSGTREVSFSNPFMTQAMLDKVWQSLENYTYMPGSLRFLGDPRIDPWDILTVEDRNGNSYKVPVMKLTMEYDGGLSTSVEAVGKSEAEQESGFQGPTAHMMDRYYAQLVVIDHALVNKIDADVVEANYVRSQTFEGLRADFESTKTRYLEFESATGNDLTLIHGNIETLEGDYAKFKTAVVGDFSAVNGQITNLSGDLSTYKTQIAGQFTAFEADIASLRSKDAELETAIIGKASVGDLDAVRTRTSQLEADYSKLNTLVNGNLTSANIQSLNLTAANTTIENGMIKNAMIESLAFDKITGIDVNTTKLTVHSEDGRSTWTDNTIQISDANRVRVQMGKDASGDYTLAVWDAAGNLIFDALGATENTIQRKIIRDAVIADDAAISGNKLDIESVVREVNGATTKLKSSTILFDEKNQTLDVAFKSMETTVVANLTESKSYTDSKASDALTSAQSYADGKASDALSNAQTYADSAAGNALSSAQGYAETQASSALGTAKTYAETQANSALNNAKTYADGAVGGIQVGGRNLLPNTSDLTKWVIESSVKVTKEDTNTFLIDDLSDRGSRWGIFLATFSLENKEYTLSYEAKGQHKIELCTHGSFTIAKILTNTTSEEYKRVVATFTPTANTYRFYINTQKEFRIRNLKLEVGNKPTDWTPAPEDTEAEITNLTEVTTTHTTQISTIQGQISSLIAEDTTIKGNYDALVSRYNSTVATVDSMQTTIGEHTTLLDSQSDKILAVQTKANTIESDLSGTKQTVSSIQTDLTNTTSRVTTVETGLDGLKTRVAATETAITKKADGTTVDSLTSRVATAESTLNGFEASLTATNKTVSDNYTELKSYTDSAKSSAISTAASDASTKANNALESAKTYAEGQASTALVNAKSYADAGIAGIRVGGRNLLLNTADLTRWNIESGVSVTKEDDGWYKITDSVHNSSRWGIYQNFYNYEQNTDYTVSVDLKNGNTTIYIAVGFGGWGNVVKTSESTDGKRFFYTFNTGSHTKTFIRIYICLGVTATNQYGYAKLPKLERGNKATDWTPAPEDIQSQIDTTNATVATHTEQISSHDTRITAAENAITLKVSTSDYEAYKTTINDEIVSAKSRLTTAESSITTIQGQIALKVEQTDIDTAVQGIQVGGRNLARNTSSEWSEWWTPAANSSNLTTTACYAYLPDVKSALDEYALSIEIEFSGVASGTGGKFYFYSQGNVDGSWGISNIWEYGAPIAVTTPPSDGIYRYTCVNKLNSSAVDAKKFAIGFRADYWDGKGKLRWRKVKVEKGNRATDWSPAPEDIDASISAVDAKFANYSTTTQMTAAITAAKDSITASVSETYATKTEVSTVSGKVTSLESWKSEASQKITKDGIVSTVGNYYALQSDFASAESRISSAETVSEQTATKFTWIVKSGTSATDFTLTDRTATLVADSINLKGLVTFSGLNSDTQSKINIAQSTADTAKANAATAQSTADTALTNANSAKAWTDANGANMTSMLSMVKKWTGDAVSDTTRINGGWIDTNTVTADKIAIGDFTNYASWKDKTAATCPFDTLGAGWSVDTSVYRTNTSCYKFTASSTGISTMGTIKIPVNVGESFYLEFYYKTDSGWTCETGNSKLRIGSASGDLIYAATILSSGSTSWAKVSGSFSIDASNATPYLLVTISMNPTTTGKRVWIDDIVIRKKTSGELIVDGSITASKIASKSITAEKIDVSDLFAQDITATGTIRGVKLVSATGSIGDLTVNSNGLAYGSLNFSSGSKFTLTKSTLQYGDFKINSAGVSVGSSSDGTFNDWPFKVYYTFQFRDYSNTMRTPIASASSTGGRVAVISSQSGKIKVSADWGNTTALSNAYISIDSSDIRLKDNIRKSTVEALPVINRMQLYEFDWKQDRKHQKIGFVADYLEEVDSRLTVGGGYDEDGRMDVKSVDSFYMLGYAVKGIQELCDITSATDRSLTVFKAETQSRIAALESRTESLQYQLQQAYTRIAELEKQLQASG